MSQLRVAELWIYPVKSMAGVRVTEARVTPRGFAGDRRWMLVHAATRQQATQRELPMLATLVATLRPGGLRITAGSETLDVSEPGVEGGNRLDVGVWEGSTPARDAGDSAAAWLSAQVGVPLRLVWQSEDDVRPVDPRFAAPGDAVSLSDGFPYLVVSAASVAHVCETAGVGADARRFRPNIVVDGCRSFAEESWSGITTEGSAGRVTFALVKPCARCVMIDNDPDRGVRQPGVLLTLAQFHRGRGNTAGGKVYLGMNGIARGAGTVYQGAPLTAELAREVP